MTSKVTGKGKKKLSPNKKVKADVPRSVRSDILLANLTPLQPHNHNGEHTIEFNKYIVVYSNNFGANLSSPWRAGETSINCYKDDKYVGCIVFYESAERLRGGYIDANDVVVIEYPIDKFEDIMRILKTFISLYLLFVEKDSQGTPLAHPVGAVMTFQKKPIGG